MAAALVEMAASVHATDREESSERAGRLASPALELAEVELHAYEPVLEALRLPRDDPERAARVEAARAEASRSPLAIAGSAAEAGRAGRGARAHRQPATSRATPSPAALLAEAAAQAAARLVAINLTEGPAVEESSQLAQRALAARERALG